MYYINKIVGWAMSPMGVLFLGLGGAWMLGVLTQRHGGTEKFWGRLRRGIIGVTLVGFWFLGTGIATRVIGVPLEGEDREVGSGQWVVDREVGSGQWVVDREVGSGQWVVGREVDAIVLLGGGIGKHEKCRRTELFSGADRAWEAARRWKAYQDGKMPLICTGVGCAEATIPLLKDWGVPAEAIVALEEPRNTEEEARMIAEAGIKRILLVTSAWHMPRARMLFERAGIEVVAAPADYEMHFAAEKPIAFGDFFPNADALARNSAAIKEWVARIGYRLLK